MIAGHWLLVHPPIRYSEADPGIWLLILALALALIFDSDIVFSRLIDGSRSLVALPGRLSPSRARSGFSFRFALPRFQATNNTSPVSCLVAPLRPDDLSMLPKEHAGHGPSGPAVASSRRPAGPSTLTA